MKITITLTVDKKIKQEAMPIIQNKMRSSVSRLVNEMFYDIVKKNKEGELSG